MVSGLADSPLTRHFPAGPKSTSLYEHSETWTFATGERGVLRFVTVHQVVDGKITVWKDYWDMNSLVSLAPPNHFETLPNADTSWIFDATALV